MNKLLMLGTVVAGSAIAASSQAAVHVETPHLQGPRQLQEQTQQTLVRDYLRSWQSLDVAMNQNNAGLLDADFVGNAKDKLAHTVAEQAGAGIHTRYQDRSHNIRFVFYSPEGLSVELTDDVEYEMQLFAQDKELGTETVHAHYVVVMTPAEVRWRVRVLQAQPQ